MAIAGYLYGSEFYEKTGQLEVIEARVMLFQSRVPRLRGIEAVYRPPFSILVCIEEGQI